MSKRSFYELAEQHGVSVDYTPGGVGRGHDITSYPFSIMLDAPKGTVFAASDLHIDGSIQGDDGTSSTDWKRATKELQSLIADGFVECTDPDCEYCNPDTED